VEKAGAWAAQTYAREALRGFVEACEEEGIDVLPVKGVVTGTLLYEDPAERVLSDVDVRIRPRDFDRVLRLGQRKGWRVVQRMRAYRNVVFVFGEITIDVEGYVGAPGLCSLGVDAMIERATRVEHLFGFSHLLPDFDDHAVLLVVNAFKDKLVHAFPWSVRDLERLAVHPEFDARRLAVRAREVDASTMTWVVADWLAHDMQAEQWVGVLEAMGNVPRRRYVRALRALRHIAPRGAFLMRILARAGSDDARARLTAFGAMAVWQLEAWASIWSEVPYVRGRPTVWTSTP
jgi:hypothetical protein